MRMIKMNFIYVSGGEGWTVYSWDRNHFQGPCFFGPQIMPSLSLNNRFNVNMLTLSESSKCFEGTWYPGVEVRPVMNSFEWKIKNLTSQIPECFSSFEYDSTLQLSKWLPERWKTQHSKITSDAWQDAWKNIVSYMNFNLDRMLHEIPLDMDIDFEENFMQIQNQQCVDGKGIRIVCDWTSHEMLQKDYMIRQMGFEIGKASKQLQICLAYEHMRVAHEQLRLVLEHVLGKGLELDAITAMIMMHWFLSEFPYYVI